MPVREIQARALQGQDLREVRRGGHHQEGHLIPYFSTQITFDNSNVRADLGDEILNWKLDVPFLRRMAYSYYKQELPGIVEGMDFPKD